MAEETKKLAEAFATKDEVEGFLANLEKLKADGSVTEEQYTTTRKEYHRRLGVATSEIARTKNQLKEQLEANQRDTETRREELGNLEVKHKVGELSLEGYQSSEQKLRAEIEKLEQYSERLTLLIQADSAADIGAPAKRPKVAAPEVPSPTRVAAPARAAAPAKKVKPRRGRLLAIVGGAVGVIVVVVLAVVLLTPGGKETTGFPPEGYETIDVAIPVDIQGATDVGSLQFELVYDEGVLRAVEVESGTLVSDAMLEYSVDVPGRVIVGIVSSHGISGDGPVAVVAFQVRGDAEMTIPLDLENLVAHDAPTMAEIPATASAGTFTAKDGSFVAPTLVFASAVGE